MVPFLLGSLDNPRESFVFSVGVRSARSLFFSGGMQTSCAPSVSIESRARVFHQSPLFQVLYDLLILKVPVSGWQGLRFLRPFCFLR